MLAEVKESWLQLGAGGGQLEPIDRLELKSSWESKPACYNVCYYI